MAILRVCRRAPIPRPPRPPACPPAVYRSSWLGAQGHEERKKVAEAAARIGAQAAAQRGQLP